MRRIPAVVCPSTQENARPPGIATLIIGDRAFLGCDDMGDVAKYVKLYREVLAPIPCGRVVPHSWLGDSLSPQSDGPRLLRRGRVSSVSGQSGACLNIT